MPASHASATIATTRRASGTLAAKEDNCEIMLQTTRVTLTGREALQFNDPRKITQYRGMRERQRIHSSSKKLGIPAKFVVEETCVRGLRALENSSPLARSQRQCVEECCQLCCPSSYLVYYTVRREGREWRTNVELETDTITISRAFRFSAYSALNTFTNTRPQHRTFSCSCSLHYRTVSTRRLTNIGRIREPFDLTRPVAAAQRNTRFSLLATRRHSNSPSDRVSKYVGAQNTSECESKSCIC